MTAQPMDFPYLRMLAQPSPSQSGAAFNVAAMVTPSHLRYGERLMTSCQRLGLPLFLFEVPAVHCSISPKGSDDLHYTKANFISFMLRHTSKPVLYLDADMVVGDRPVRIDELVAEGVDFAIYNWMADKDTAAYVPVDLTLDGQATGKRFYKFSHSMDLFDPEQLFCSGAVQFYNNTAAARGLLALWQSVIEQTPRSQDDHCLDLAYNNRPPELRDIRAVWLGKAYCRYCWWIFTKPVIDHPQFPAFTDSYEGLVALDGKQRFSHERANRETLTHTDQVLRQCLIDTQLQYLVKVENGTLTPAVKYSDPTYLEQELPG